MCCCGGSHSFGREYFPVNSFDDGNVIVVVGTTEFRLYRGFLARHSTVFEEIFEDPYPPEDAELIDGIPVERVDESGSGRDFDCMLDVLMGKPSEDLDVEEVSSILKVSWKYDIGMVINWARERIKRLLPTTEADWDADPAFAHYSNSSELRYAISAGLRFDIPEILPPVMYAAAVQREPLDLPKDMKVVTQVIESGRFKYQAVAMDYLRLIPEYGMLDEDTGCLNRCVKDIQNHSEDWMLAFVRDPLGSLSKGTSKPVQENWCKTCIAINDTIRKQLRTKLFNKLPEFFHVDYDPSSDSSSTSSG